MFVRDLSGDRFPAGAYHEIRQGLFEPTMRFEGDDRGAEVLAPWAAAHVDVLGALRSAGDERSASVAFEARDRWRCTR